jgi:hypothetical protein
MTRSAASRLVIAAGLALLYLGGGCRASGVPEHWGDAHRENVARMTENPGAERENLQAPQGLDAATAEKVIEGYQEKQGEKRPPRMPSIIQLSTGGDKR